MYEGLEENKSTKSNAWERKLHLGCCRKCSAGGRNEALGLSAYLRPGFSTTSLSDEASQHRHKANPMPKFHGRQDRFFKLSINSEAKGFEFKYPNAYLQIA